MNDCLGTPARECLEQYVDGSLPEQEAVKFEEHYFECPVCLAELQALQAAQEQLRHHPIAVKPQRQVLSWPAMVSFGALAAALLVGLITLRMIHPGSQGSGSVALSKPAPAPAQAAPPAGQQQLQVAELADLHLPSYNAPVLRGASEDGAFQRGMKQYVQGDCAQAAKTLAQVQGAGPNAVAAKFYSGVCRMHIGDLTGASATLHRVTAAGDSPQEESAWYYLAQIALVKSDTAEARRDLNRVVSLRGDLESQARKQLTEIPSTPGK